jgi:hypothetical protein
MYIRMAYRTLFTLACALVFVSLAAAHELSFAQRMRIGNGPELQPGTYRVEVVKKSDSVEVTFSQGDDLMLTVPATLTQEASKCKSTEIYTETVDGGRVITKIRFQGSKESLVFTQDTPKAE